MASEVEIVNVALTLLGEDRILSLDDDVKAAREAKAIFDVNRNSLMAGYSWSFAMKRTTLNQDGTPPEWGYNARYLMPGSSLRVVQIGDYFPGIDLTDYRGAHTEEYQIEGRYILTNLGAPLKFRYVNVTEDPNLFAASFVKAFAAYLAADLAEPLTQSDTKRERALGQLQREISLAIRANAIELPPKKLADDDWLLARL